MLSAPSVLASNLLYVRLSVVLENLSSTEVKAYPNKSPSVLKTSILRRCLPWSYFCHFWTAVNRVSSVSLIIAHLAESPVRDMGGYALPDKYKENAGIKLCVNAPGGPLESTEPNNIPVFL